MTPDQLPYRFAVKVGVNPVTGCWIFTGAVNSKGYGQIAVDGDGSSSLAHRAAYELLVGPIPEGLQIDHLCLVKRCCNPAHLEAVTPGENNRRAATWGLNLTVVSDTPATHCIHGHEWTEANTYVPPTGGRDCRECRRLRDRARYETKYAARKAKAAAQRQDGAA